MIVGCPACKTKFLVNPESISLEGRSVKCAKCSHVWFQELHDEEKADLQKKINSKIDDDSSKEISAESNKQKSQEIVEYNQANLCQNIVLLALKLVNIIAIIFMILFPFLIYKYEISSSAKFMQDFYKSIGLYDTSGVVLNEVIIQNDIDRLILKGQILNVMDKPVPFPQLKISVYDHDKNLLAETYRNYDKEELKPFEAYDFSNKLVNLPENSSLLILDIGNNLELSLRDVSTIKE